MSRILKSFFVSCFIFSTFFITDLAQARLVDEESSCLYRLLCEHQARVIEKIDVVVMRVAQLSNQELVFELLGSLEGARALAQQGHIGKSLMSLNMIERVVSRESASISLPATTTIDALVSTTTEMFFIGEDGDDVDNDQIILSE